MGRDYKAVMYLIRSDILESLQEACVDALVKRGLHVLVNCPNLATVWNEAGLPQSCLNSNFNSFIECLDVQWKCLMYNVVAGTK